MSGYGALASSYDGLMADGAYRRRADFLERLFRKSRIPVESVLDLACGTGTIACLLAERGWSLRRCSSTRPCPGCGCSSR